MGIQFLRLEFGGFLERIDLRLTQCWRRYFGRKAFWLMLAGSAVPFGVPFLLQLFGQPGSVPGDQCFLRRSGNLSCSRGQPEPDLVPAPRCEIQELDSCGSLELMSPHDAARGLK